MSYKISKELFETVMKVKTEYYNVNEFMGIKSLIVYDLEYISTNDFFFKCKEWLIGRGYDNWSGYHENEYFCFIITKGAFISTSEQQAVFDACQWILNNKDRQ